jgi:DNA-binding transcriptional LysR family regulator
MLEKVVVMDFKPAVGAVEQLEGHAGSLRGDASQSVNIRLGAPREFFQIEGLARLRTLTNPAFQLQVTFGDTLSLIRGLEVDAFDAVIATQKIARRGWHYQPILTETFIAIGQAAWVVPRDLSLESAESWLSQQPWIAYGPDMPLIRRYWQDVFGNRPTFAPRLVLPDVLGIIRAVSLGLGLSIVPSYLCREELVTGLIREVWSPPEPSTNTLYLACERSRLETPAVQWVTNLLRNWSAYS